MKLSSLISVALAAAAVVVACSGAAYAYSRQVVTHHYDNGRSGWSSREAILTPQNVGSDQFGLLATVPLNGTAYAQPLIAPDQQITTGDHAGTYASVVYVATSTNWVYAIDGATGQILLSRNLGPYVTATPCAVLGGQVVGVVGTPVIDVNNHTIVLVNATYVDGTPTFHLHALNLSDLEDTQYSPVTIAGSHTLSDGTSVTFNAYYHKQAPALLYTNSYIYVGFGSWCDHSKSMTRGWLFGFHHTTLSPLRTNRLNNALAPTPDDQIFLSSIWMSGSGLAAVPGAFSSIYYLTGNSKADTYNRAYNVQESFVRVSPGLSFVEGLFTPSAQASWDAVDKDFGSGGVLLLPPQPGAYPNLALAAGKSGDLFLINTDKPGGFTPGGPDKVVDIQQIGACLCASSYYVPSDGVTRVVTSGTRGLIVWRLETSPTTKLVQESTPVVLQGGSTPGYFTTISTNRSTAGTEIIWSVQRPRTAISGDITLFAYAATPDANGTLTQLYSSVAGNWSAYGGANIVPVVANGKVYVASTQQLQIFGLRPPGTGAVAQARALVKIATGPDDPDPLSKQYPNQVSGVIDSIKGASLSLKTRQGSTLAVDAAAAIKAEQTGVLYVGATVTVEGVYDKAGFKAVVIVRADGTPQQWPADH